jgi:hypothetical protein
MAIILPLAIIGGLATTGYVATDGFSARDDVYSSEEAFRVQSYGVNPRKSHAICDQASGGSGRLEACGRGITGGGSNTGSSN